MSKLVSRCFFIFLVFVASVGSNSQQAQANSELENAIIMANEKELYTHQDWLHLVQYTPRVLARYKSEIRSDYSFFASDGKQNPQAELAATLRALYNGASSEQDVNEHPRCKFIARYEFLKTHLALPSELERLSCPKFEAWIRPEEISSVSLVFASGYFRNPASFFGHPILKFNKSKGRDTSLLDITINNGAIVPPNENPIAYIVKGVFGGYQAGFSDTQFYQLNHSYVESDLRDLWHYELDLNEQQINKLVYYSWELLGQRFTYRFFSNNCGYFLEDLLQYALGERISPRNRIYSIPSTTFFNLVTANNQGRNLVKNIHRTPSRHSQFFEKYTTLSEGEKSAVAYFLKTQTLDRQLSELSQIRVIDTLTDYLSFLLSKSKNEEKQSEIKRQRTRLFSRRLSLTRSDIKWPEVISSTPPHAGNKPTLFRVSALHNSEFGSGIKLRFRPASYDVVDLDGGHVPDSKLNMFNIEAIAVDGEQRLTRLDIVDITTLNLSRTGLPKDGGRGWGLRFGLERADEECLDCLLTYVAGSAFKAKKINDQWTAYLQAEANYHSKYLDSSAWVSTSTALIGHILPAWKSHLSVGRRWHIEGSNTDETIFRWENRFGKNTHSNFRFDISHNKQTEVTIGYGIYW